MCNEMVSKISFFLILLNETALIYFNDMDCEFFIMILRYTDTKGDDRSCIVTLLPCRTVLVYSNNNYKLDWLKKINI